MSVFDLTVRFGGVSQVTATLGPNDPQVGQTAREGNAEYIFVYNAGNSQISPGYGAVCSGVSGYSVTVSSVAANNDVPIGVCVHATLTTATYGFLLKKGFCTFVAAANSGAVAGLPLIMGDDGTWATKSISTGAAGNTYGKVMVATASAGVGSAYFQIY